MKQTLITLSLLLSFTFSFGQSFEGEIVYSATYKSKISGLTDQQVSSMIGSAQNYYIRGGDYKAESNGTLAVWQLYINKDNKLYYKLSSSDTLAWKDATVNTDSVITSELHKGVTEILGYKCDELVLTCKNEIQKYYFTSKLRVDSKLYANHLIDNWYFYLSKTNAMPLKIVVDNAQFTMELTATDVKPMKLEQSFFTLPAGAKTAKSSY